MLWKSFTYSKGLQRKIIDVFDRVDYMLEKDRIHGPCVLLVSCRKLSVPKLGRGPGAEIGSIMFYARTTHDHDSFVKVFHKEP